MALLPFQKSYQVLKILKNADKKHFVRPSKLSYLQNVLIEKNIASDFQLFVEAQRGLIMSECRPAFKPFLVQAILNLFYTHHPGLPFCSNYILNF